MEGSGIDLEMNVDPRLPKRRDRGIGCIGSGFVMPDIHLVAYQRAGFRPVGPGFAHAPNTPGRLLGPARSPEGPRHLASS